MLMVWLETTGNNGQAMALAAAFSVTSPGRKRAEKTSLKPGKRLRNQNGTRISC